MLFTIIKIQMHMYMYNIYKYLFYVYVFPCVSIYLHIYIYTRISRTAWNFHHRLFVDRPGGRLERPGGSLGCSTPIPRHLADAQPPFSCPEIDGFHVGLYGLSCFGPYNGGV